MVLPACSSFKDHPRPTPIHRPFSQAPYPVWDGKPVCTDPTAFPRPHIYSKATSAYPNAFCISEAHNTTITALPEASRKPCERQRDEVSRD